MSEIIIRSATTEDATEILQIYSYYIENTAITMEYAVPTVEEFKERIRNTMENYPYLVAEQGGKIIAYAYAGKFHPRAGFSYCAEISIYVDKDAKRCGMGRRLYEAIEEKLKRQGVKNVYASISYIEIEDEYLTNNSMQFHEHMGYQLVAHFHHCAYKFDRWYDLIWMEKRFNC